MINSDSENQSNIGLEFIKNLYTDTTLETKEPQPFYILQRDTIRTFLHEKIDLLRIQAKFIGLIGIELTLIISLLTTTFKDIWKINANIIQGLFIAFALIIVVYLAKSFTKWLGVYKTLNVDWLSKDLGERGTIIKSAKKKEDNRGLDLPQTKRIPVIKVLEAKYYTENKSLDVTDKINQMVRNCKRKITASNKIAGDPEKRVRKKLTIHYGIDGKIAKKTCNERETISLS